MDTLRYAEGGQRTCALHPEQPDHVPKVLAPVTVGSENATTGIYEGKVDRTYCLHPIGHLGEAPMYLLDQRKVIAREAMHGVGDTPFPPGRVGHGHDA